MKIYKTIKLSNKLKYETIRQYFVLNILWLQAKLFQYLTFLYVFTTKTFYESMVRRCIPLFGMKVELISGCSKAQTYPPTWSTWNLKVS